MFEKIAKKGHFTAEEFAQWLSKEQGEKVEVAQAKQIIADVEKKDHGKDSGKTSLICKLTFRTSLQYWFRCLFDFF